MLVEEAAVASREEQIALELLRGRQLRLLVPPKHLDELGRNIGPLTQLGLGRAHHLVTEGVRAPNEDHTLVPLDVWRGSLAAQRSHRRRAQPRREAQELLASYVRTTTERQERAAARAAHRARSPSTTARWDAPRPPTAEDAIPATDDACDAAR